MTSGSQTGWKATLERIFGASRLWSRLGLAAAFVIIVFGISLRAQVPAIAVADPDSWGYFKPALSLLSGEGFTQVNGRDWFYSVLVAGAVQITGSIAGLVRFQQLLGVLSAVLLIVALRSWAGFLPATALREALVAIFGTLALALYFLRPQTLLFEVQLRPESVWTFFIFVQLLFILAYAHARWVTGQLGWAMIFGIKAFALAYLVLLLKPSWAGAAVATTLPIFIGVFGTRQGLAWRFLTPILAVIVTVLVLWLPPRLFFQRDQVSEDRFPLALFTIHSKWILEHLEKKAPQLPPDSAEAKFLQKFLPVFRTEFAHTMDEDSVYRQLGYDADYLRYRSPIFGWLRDEGGLDSDRRNAFCFSTYLGAWQTQTLGMTGKVAGQFSLFLLPEYATFYKKGIDFRDRYETTTEKLPADPGKLSPRVYELYFEFRNAVIEAAKQKRDLEPVLVLQDVARAVSFVFPILVVLLLTVLVLVTIKPALLPLRLGAWLALLLYGAPAGNAITVSIIHALDVNRYRLSYAGPLLLAGAALAILIVITAEQLIRRRQPR